MSDEVKKFESEATEIVQRAELYEIKNQAEYEAAGWFLKGMVKDLKTKIVGFFDPHIKRAHEAHKALTTEKKNHLGPVEKAEAIIKQKMMAYYREQERIRIAEQRKAEEAARKKAEAERERLMRQAQKAEEKGDKERAEELLDRTEEVFDSPVTVAPKVEKVAGIAIKENWTFEIKDKSKLIAALLANPMTAHIVTVDEVALRKLVKSMKKNLKVEGLHVYDAGSVAA